MSSSVYKKSEEHTEVQVYGDNLHLYCVQCAPQHAALHVLQICLCPHERKKCVLGLKGGELLYLCPSESTGGLRPTVLRRFVFLCSH